MISRDAVLSAMPAGPSFGTGRGHRDKTVPAPRRASSTSFAKSERERVSLRFDLVDHCFCYCIARRPAYFIPIPEWSKSFAGSRALQGILAELPCGCTSLYDGLGQRAPSLPALWLADGIRGLQGLALRIAGTLNSESTSTERHGDCRFAYRWRNPVIEVLHVRPRPVHRLGSRTTRDQSVVRTSDGSRLTTLCDGP